ncbi:cation channel sperm-associated auxiliary subunit zeta isoform X3 [Bubalus kerabau]|uniref:cation channel sperm-associated auxiliary subunit zeta isoform X3 n=1 Tax=Bubalus carabanensis TaxID=3119969 RepID=UPI00244E9AFA|nr:cation channel sperm-associated auxiliary subunit zeta isoform X3 [Bubalus carabanensis]
MEGKPLKPKLNVQLPTVREDSELEDVSVSGKTRWSYDQKAGHDAEGGWEASDGGEDKDTFKPEEPEELELGGDSSQGSRLEEDDSKTDNAFLSVIAQYLEAHTPSSLLGGTAEQGWRHQGDWEYSGGWRLPLPLTELMENEALEILTEALRTLPSRLPIRDRPGPFPDQTAAAIHRGAQKAPEQEAASLGDLRAPPRAPASARLQPWSLSSTQIQARPCPRGI